MSDTNAGIVYENKVKSVIRQAAKAIPHLKLIQSGSSGKFDNRYADLYLQYHKTKMAVELKLDPHAPMGSPAKIQYEIAGQKLSFIDNNDNSIDIPTQNMMLDALKPVRKNIEALITFIRTYPASAYNDSVNGIPFTCTKEAWDAAVAKGLLRPLNINIRNSVSFIAKHYASKNTHYINIGKLGMFYMKDNPLDLPVPKLEGDINIEIRMKSRGAKERKAAGLIVVTGVMIASARLITKSQKSNYSLDNRDNVLMLFGR